MQRVTALWQASPNKIVGALFALALAAMMAVASGASFTSTSANVGNIVTAGILEHENSAPGQAILTVDKLVPEQVKSGTVSIENTGDVKGLLSLTKSDLEDTDANDDATTPLSERLELTVTDTTGTPDEVYQGTLEDMSAEDLGEIAAGDTHTYRFDVRLPDGGNDNAYQGDSVEVDFNWETVSN